MWLAALNNGDVKKLDFASCEKRFINLEDSYTEYLSSEPVEL